MTKSQSWNDTWGKICCGETKKEELIILIDELLANKTSVNLTDEEGKTPLMHIISLGLTETVKKVIEMGADVNAKDHTGITALMIASDYGDTEVVEHLVSCNADVNAKDKDGWTAMIFACILPRSQKICNAAHDFGCGRHPVILIYYYN